MAEVELLQLWSVHTRLSPVTGCVQNFHCVPHNRPKTIRMHVIVTTDAGTIKLFNPSLCTLKSFVQTPTLLWPPKHHGLDAKFQLNDQDYNDSRLAQVS